MGVLLDPKACMLSNDQFSPCMTEEQIGRRPGGDCLVEDAQLSNDQSISSALFSTLVSAADDSSSELMLQVSSTEAWSSVTHCALIQCH